MPRLGLDDVNNNFSGSKVISISEHTAYIFKHGLCFEINCAHSDDDVDVFFLSSTQGTYRINVT